jgi:hypothetical protein
LLDCLRGWVAGVIRRRRGYGGQADPGCSSVDLTRWHFPNRCADWDAFLVNEDDVAVTRHRRNNDSRFAMHDRPCSWSRTCGCSHVVGHDLDMRIRKVPLTRHGFPVAVFHPAIVVAAVLSGNCWIPQSRL